MSRRGGLSEAEIDDVLVLLRQVSAAEILPRFRRLDAGDIRHKTGPLDLVTVADEAAEAALASGLRTLFPEIAVIGEESVAAEPDLLQRLSRPGAVWVIDPIDGTANFASDLPLFGVMLALVEDGEILAGFIHDPIGDDTAIALAGKGAWMQTREGARRPLRAAAAAPIVEMTGSKRSNL